VFGCLSDFSQYSKNAICDVADWTVEILNESVESELLALPKDMQVRFLRISELLETFGPAQYRFKLDTVMLIKLFHKGAGTSLSSEAQANPRPAAKRGSEPGRLCPLSERF
jgi:hypothetical protein